MKDKLLVRIATRDDAEKIAEFNVRFAKSTIDKNVPMQVTAKGVHSVFSKFNNGFYIVGELEREIVGVTMITREWSDWNNGAYYCVQGIFVNHEEEESIHNLIYKKAKSLAKEHDDVCGLRLYVHVDDKETQIKYENLGMTKTPYRVFEEDFGRD